MVSLLVTKEKAFTSVVSVHFSTAIFCCLILTGVPQKFKDAIDLVLPSKRKWGGSWSLVPSYAVVLITIVFYILQHCAMKKKIATNETELHPVRKTIITEMQRSFVRLNEVLLIVCFKIVFRANNSNDDHNAVNGGQSYSFKNQPDFCCKCDNR